MSWHINVTVSGLNSLRLEMETRGLTNVVRSPVHYYNSEAEIDRCCTHWQGYAARDAPPQREIERMAERKSISTVHVFWREQEGAAGGWYIETRNAYSEAVGDSRQPDWDGPPPKHYQKHDAEKLCAHLQLWEPEARVVMHL